MRRVIALMTVVLALATACSSNGEAGTTTTAPPTSSPAATTTTQAPPETTQAPPETTQAPPETTLPPSALEQATAELTGLGFDDFVDGSFDILLLRSPQTLIEAGIADRYGLANDRLDDLSDAFIHETMDLQSLILDLLRSYDRESLDEQQQLTYDVYEWYLADLVAGHPFVYHRYLIHHFLDSYNFDAIDFFTDVFPLETAADAAGYVACVGQMRGQVDDVLEGLRIREDLGIYPPDYILWMALHGMLGQLGVASTNEAVAVTSLEIYTRFEEATAGIEDLDEASRAALLSDLESALRESLVPAWLELIEYTEHLYGVAGSDAGVWALPDGDAYYAYLLRRETSTGLTAEEIHAVGLAEVERIHGEFRDLFDTLGYPADESLAASMDRIAVEGGTIDTRGGPEELVAAYEALLAGVEEAIVPVFGTLPTQRVEVIPEMSFGGGGGYYTPPSLDGVRPGAFHTGAAPGIVYRYAMPDLLYHEAVPGHHTQLALVQQLDLPLMRSVISFNAYVEGWALYAERLASELGLYEDDPYGEAGRLRLELLRAVRLVTDTGIHAMGWTREEAKAYMTEALGSDGSNHEADRYIVLPGQATGYMVGMLEVLRLRDLAQEEMGDAFDLAGFHDVVLGNGSVPLDLLAGLVEDWIAAGS